MGRGLVSIKAGDEAGGRQSPSIAAPLSMTVRTPRYQRPLDLVVGATLLTLSFPIAVLTAILVKLTSPGPIIFKQERVGRDGRTFVTYKFRTMQVGTDSRIHEEYFQQYFQGVSVPGASRAVYKLHHDPRITPVGKVLRRLGLDEIPQLVNVLRGEMSLVGPRPPLAYEVAHYQPKHHQRLSVQPGLTGLWQVRGRDAVDFETMVDMDLEYIRLQSLRFDLALLLLTLPSLLFSCVRPGVTRKQLPGEVQQ